MSWRRLEAGVSKAVHVSTFAVWGSRCRTPSTSGRRRARSVDRVRRTKHEGNLLLWEHYRERDLPVVALYPGAVLGPEDPKSTGQYVRDLVERRVPAREFEDSAFTFVHVDDVAEAIVRALEKEGNLGEKYLIGKHALSMSDVNRMVSEISGVPLPKMRLPGPVVMAGAALMTKASDLSGRPPLSGMSTDMMRNIRESAVFDGSKSERELGLAYTPIRKAIEEEVSSLRR